MKHHAARGKVYTSYIKDLSEAVTRAKYIHLVYKQIIKRVQKSNAHDMTLQVTTGGDVLESDGASCGLSRVGQSLPPVHDWFP